MSAGLDSTSATRWLTLLLCAASLWLCWPLWPALVLAAWTALLLRPVLERLQLRFRGRQRAAAVLTFLVAMAIATPLVLLGVGVFLGIADLADTLSSSPSAGSALEQLAIGAGDGGERLKLPSTLGEAVALFKGYGAQAFALLSNLAGAAAEALLLLVVYFAGTFVFMRRGRRDWEWIAEHVPLRREHLDRFGRAFEETGRGLLIGVGLTCAAQGAVAMVAYFAVGVPQAVVLGPLTGIASVIPVVGSAMIWIPIAVGLLLTDHPIRAAILTVIGLGVIGTIDNLLRPIFSRMGALQMPVLVLFVSAFGGLVVLGGWGAILGPLIVRLTMEALEISRAEALAAAAAD